MICEACGGDFVFVFMGSCRSCPSCDTHWEFIKGEWVIIKKACTCDERGDLPCPQHGFINLCCSCGGRVRAPSVVREGWLIECPKCKKRCIGVEKEGLWEKYEGKVEEIKNAILSLENKP